MTQLPQEADFFKCGPSDEPLISNDQDNTQQEEAKKNGEDPFKTFGKSLNKGRKSTLKKSLARSSEKIKGEDAFAAFDTVNVRPSMKRGRSSDLDLEAGERAADVLIEPLKLC